MVIKMSDIIVSITGIQLKDFTLGNNIPLAVWEYHSLCVKDRIKDNRRSEKSVWKSAPWSRNAGNLDKSEVRI